MGNFIYKNNFVETGFKYDVVVIGGGTAGSTAAIASAMSGANTLLIDRNTFMGGTSTGGQVTPMMFNGVDGDMSSSSINEMIKKSLSVNEYCLSDGCGNDGWFNPEMLKFALENTYLDNNGKLLYESEFIDSIVENSHISGVIVHNRSGFQLIESRIFIDCTGDAEVAFASGVPCEYGDDVSHKNQSASLRFMVSNIDMKCLDSFLKGIGENVVLKLPLLEIASECELDTELSKIFKKAVTDGKLAYEDTVYIQGFAVPGMPGTISFNCPEIPDIDNYLSAWEMTSALVKGRKMISKLFDFLKSNIDGFKNSFIMSVATMPGVRETRRIQGQYVLDVSDFQYRRKFDDSIARTAYPIDIHGENAIKYLNMKPLERGEFVEIPFRCLVPKSIENLLVAGRCISSSFVAQSAIRIQPTCHQTGEAAGVAAAYCCANNINIQDLDAQIVCSIMRDFKAGFKDVLENKN